jgi:hypothetical protein
VFLVRYEHHLHIKSKAISVKGRVGLQSYETLRISYYEENSLIDGGEVVSLTHKPCSTPQKLSFPVLLEAEYTPGPCEE